MSRPLQSRPASRPSRASYTAGIIDAPRHPCGSVINNKLLAIIDLDGPGCRSVTNAIEDVLHELRQRYGRDLPSIIIYRDTEGVWDGVVHIEGTFRSFYPIRETDLARAIDKARAPRQPATSTNAASERLDPR